MIETVGGYDKNSLYTQSGFGTELNSYNPNLNICSGRTDLLHKSFFAPYYMLCNEISGDNTSCSMWDGCSWNSLLSICDGHFTNYSLINMTSPESVCENMTDRFSCETFNCIWVNSTADIDKVYQSTSSYRVLNSIIDTVKLMSGFRTGTFGIQQLSFIFVFFFTYLPLIMLLLAIYFMLPFI